MPVFNEDHLIWALRIEGTPGLAAVIRPSLDGEFVRTHRRAPNKGESDEAVKSFITEFLQRHPEL